MIIRSIGGADYSYRHQLGLTTDCSNNRLDYAYDRCIGTALLSAYFHFPIHCSEIYTVPHKNTPKTLQKSSIKLSQLSINQYSFI